MSLTLNQHELNCHPGAPCRSCRILAFLKNKLSEADYSAFRKILDETNPLLTDPIREVMQLTTRTHNLLEKNGIHTFGDLICMTKEKLLKIPHFGNKSMNEIRGCLEEMGRRIE